MARVRYIMQKDFSSNIQEYLRALIDFFEEDDVLRNLDVARLYF